MGYTWTLTEITTLWWDKVHAHRPNWTQLSFETARRRWLFFPRQQGPCLMSMLQCMSYSPSWWWIASRPSGQEIVEIEKWCFEFSMHNVHYIEQFGSILEQHGAFWGKGTACAQTKMPASSCDRGNCTACARPIAQHVHFWPTLTCLATHPGVCVKLWDNIHIWWKHSQYCFLIKTICTY